MKYVSVSVPLPAAAHIKAENIQLRATGLELPICLPQGF